MDEKDLIEELGANNPIPIVNRFEKTYSGRTKRTFHLGDYHYVYGRICQFIKVTPKGFNFVKLLDHKCVFKTHLYSPSHKQKYIPKFETSFQVSITNNVSWNISSSLQKKVDKLG